MFVLSSTFFAAVCSGLGEPDDYMPVTLLGLVLMAELQRATVYSTV